ncbi:hypothetical protein FA15DRAFT_584896 [Coprinopsis marcescibilis]|uniref:F-box domain-containing protein n=1 Tax=Coprinopsis marcescibilis TaxID=230819 RepID=A0A5C3L5R7_COPMA|nr:hypothetical protein FA15DRAFT_584896 [Coprinopsis marcescibilis]
MFLNLPQDIILAVCEHLQPQDLLLLQQTCRGLHDLTAADYLWRGLSFDLPLDLPAVRSNLSGRQIQQSAVRALRVEHNWHQRQSKIRRLTRIPNLGTVVQLQLIGPSSQHLVLLSHSGRVRHTRVTTHLSVWHIPSSGQPSCLTSIEVPHAKNSKFTAAYCDRNQEALIAVSAGDNHVKSLLKVFTVSLHDVRDGFDNNSSVAKEIFCEMRTDDGEIFFDVQISGSTIVAGLATLAQDTSSMIPVAYQILLIDLNTHRRTVVGIPSQGLERIRLKLYRDVLFVIGVQNTALLVSTHQWPPDAEVVANGEQLPWMSKYRLVVPGPDFEYHLSDENTALCDPTLTLLALTDHASSFSAYPQQKISVFNIAFKSNTVSDEERPLNPSYVFTPARGAYRAFICLGKTGYRLVWQENWVGEDTEMDEYQFMKASFSESSGVYAEPLWPKHAVLPFQPSASRSACFEEATGKLCLALWTEEVYVVQF